MPRGGRSRCSRARSACADLAIGLGVVIALDRGTPVRGWIEAARCRT
jgi:hypothetical protein